MLGKFEFELNFLISLTRLDLALGRNCVLRKLITVSVTRGVTSVFLPRDSNFDLRVGSPSGFAPDGCGFGAIFLPVGLPEPDPDVIGCGFGFQIPPTGPHRVPETAHIVRIWPRPKLTLPHYYLVHDSP
jgi:hypothetical protein